MSDKTWITGEFVETVQLQVVCQTLINKLAPDATEISMEHLEAYGSLDKALQVFYEDSVREVVEKTREELRSKANAQRSTLNAQHPMQKLPVRLRLPCSKCQMFAESFSRHRAAPSAKRPQNSFRILRSNRR